MDSYYIEFFRGLSALFNRLADAGEKHRAEIDEMLHKMEERRKLTIEERLKLNQVDPL